MCTPWSIWGGGITACIHHLNATITIIEQKSNQYSEQHKQRRLFKSSVSNNNNKNAAIWGDRKVCLDYVEYLKCYYFSPNVLGRMERCKLSSTSKYAWAQEVLESLIYRLCANSTAVKLGCGLTSPVIKIHAPKTCSTGFRTYETMRLCFITNTWHTASAGCK